MCANGGVHLAAKSWDGFADKFETAFKFVIKETGANLVAFKLEMFVVAIACAEFEGLERADVSVELTTKIIAQLAQINADAFLFALFLAFTLFAFFFLAFEVFFG